MRKKSIREMIADKLAILDWSILAAASTDSSAGEAAPPSTPRETIETSRSPEAAERRYVDDVNTTGTVEWPAKT
jgi:hypothetical protein